MTSSKIAKNALLAALAIIFGYIESLLPAAPIPGVKLGISNIVILFALKSSDKFGAVFIMLLKVLVSSLLFSGFNTLFYSLTGGILSLIAMDIALHFKFGTAAAGIAGGVFHNIGQIIASAAVLGSTAVFAYLPVLLVSGTAVGFITGSVCKTVLSRIHIN